MLLKPMGFFSGRIDKLGLTSAQKNSIDNEFLFSRHQANTRHKFIRMRTNPRIE
jgi:hypothetical protein